jgi:hypothetical protein
MIFCVCDLVRGRRVLEYPSALTMKAAGSCTGLYGVTFRNTEPFKVTFTLNEVLIARNVQLKFEHFAKLAF